MEQFNNLFYFIEKFPDDLTCRKYLEERLWKNKPVCAHCGNEDKIYRYKNGKLFKCTTCKKQFKVTTGTIYENSNIPLRKWFLAFYLIAISKKSISSIELGKTLGITQKSAWYLMHKIRYMFLHNEPEQQLQKVVEVDETYIGGKKRGKRSRGSENKTPVFGMIQRRGKLIITPVENTKRKTLEPIIKANVKAGAHMMSDEWHAYKQLHLSYKHSVVNHGRHEYVNGHAHTNTLEGTWSLLKRIIRGIYHRPSKEHLAKYCAEFQFNYNTRNNSPTLRFKKTIAKNNIRVKYKDVT
jgi:transposase-like protein